MEKIFEVFYDQPSRHVWVEPTAELSQPDNVCVMIGFCEILYQMLEKLSKTGKDIEECKALAFDLVESYINENHITN